MDTILRRDIDTYFEKLDDQKIRLIRDIKTHGSMLRRYDAILSDRNNRYQDSFQTQLNRYTKMLFDPFARNTIKYPKFTYTFSNGIQIDTTLAQLNFFMWMIKNDVVDYINK